MSYDASSIQIRDFRTAARATPGMYIGAEGQDGIFNCFMEILNNACFIAGHQVLTKEGEKSIETITENDYIFNKNGDWEKVNYPTSRQYDGVGYRLVLGGGRKDIVCTENHKFLVYCAKWGGQSSPFQWLEAKELRVGNEYSRRRKHYLLFPIAKGCTYQDDTERSTIIYNSVKYLKVLIKEKIPLEIHETVYCLNVNSHSFCCNGVIVHNCDEALMKRGNVITVNLEDDAVSVVDNGAGCPHGKNKDSNEVLIELFTKAHTSGKFQSDNYKCVRGIHGIGSSAVCVCSTIFQVWTRREGYEWYMEFKEGIPQFEVAKKGRAVKETGSTFRFAPDNTVFKVPEGEPYFVYDRIKEELQLTSYFIPNVSFVLNYAGKTETFLSENGLKDFAATQIKKPLHKNYIYGKKEFDNNTEIEVFAQWTEGKEAGFVFSNGALNASGGTPISGAKAAFSRTVNILSKKNFNPDLVRKGLVYIINVRLPYPVYQNQVKDKIMNQELKGYTQTVFTEALKSWATVNPDEAAKVFDVLSRVERAEEAAIAARDAVLNTQAEVERNQKKKVFSSDILKDAEFLGEDATLLIVEGNSAASSIAQARDEKHYGILPVRGKILNLLSNTEERMEQSDTIKLLLSAMNIVPGRYNPDKLRYGKLAICSDADSDGYHIGLLVMAAMRKIAPQFIEEGRLCWLRAPLYIEKSGSKEKYYFTDDELNAARKSIKGILSREKGLGSMTAEQARASMFDPKNQHMDVLNSTPEAMQLLENLMGENAEFRKDYIFKNVDFSKISE